jgi:hypothetical protein
MLTISIKKIADFVDVDFDNLPPNSVQYVVEYGLTQCLNDCHASVIKKGWKGTDEEFTAAVWKEVNAKMDQLKTGDFSRKAPVALTPETREFVKLGITESEWELLKEQVAQMRAAA